MPDTPATHLEVEIKLDADADFVLPDLAALPGVAQVEPVPAVKLAATYLDTDDLALMRNRTTFRRRTGGSDAGWHLKLPASKDERLEIHEPVGRSVRAVPPRLTGLVRVQLQGAPVAPVAKISTTRAVHRLLDADGRVLAEVADDLVVADELGGTTAGSSWREIEVELVDGDRAVLNRARKLLRAAGARPAGHASKLQRALARRLAEAPASGEAPAADDTTAGGAAVRYLSAQLDAIVAEDPRVRLDAEDAVHRMRVATRRARAALAAFRPLFTEGATDELRAELKWLAGVLGAARDAEVMRQELTDQVAALPVELVLGPVRQRIDLELGEAYRTAHDAVIETLDGERYLDLVRALGAFVADPPFAERAAGPADEELRGRVRKAVRRVRAAVAVADTLPPGSERDVQLHEVRIAAKRARYAAEATQAVAGKKAKRVVSVMKAVQETLGHHQDAVVERTWLRDLGVRAHGAGENGFTFGLLHGATLAQAEHDEEQFATVWEQAQPRLAAWPG
jgi:CHAD domain-containing protein